MNQLRRLRGSKRICALTLTSILAFGWCALYLSSLYQCRKAERLLAHLRRFPFATAGFAEVRDFSLQYGGSPLREASQTSPFGCTEQVCTFQIWLGRPLSRPPMNQWLLQYLYPALPYVGLRPWIIFTEFEVRGGALMRSTTTVGQLKRGGFTIEYSIHTQRSATPYSRSDDRPNEYVVVAPHVTGPPTEVLSAWVVQTPDAPMNHVFDVDLRCFMTLFHGCSDLRALAPSAWQHYRDRNGE
jgi:hypothetical protein